MGDLWEEAQRWADTRLDTPEGIVSGIAILCLFLVAAWLVSGITGRRDG